jgi:Protein of unknown function (DUF2846)
MAAAAPLRADIQKIAHRSRCFLSKRLHRGNAPKVNCPGTVLSLQRNLSFARTDVPLCYASSFSNLKSWRKTQMRNLTVGLAVLLASAAAHAQSAPPKLECRDMSRTGNFVNSDETYVNGMACKNAEQAPSVQPVAAVVAPSHSAQPMQARALIYFYRPNRFEGSGTNPELYVDGVKSGHLHNGESLSLYVTPGHHRLHSQGNPVNIDVDAQAGETYHVRYDVTVSFLKERANLELVKPQDAANETAQITHQSEGGN